jgi:hypothetical protein
MSKDGLLSEKEVAKLKARRDFLKRQIGHRSYTWEEAFGEPPPKSEEEFRKLQEDFKVELEAIEKLLKENTRKKAANTRERNRRARMARR